MLIRRPDPNTPILPSEITPPQVYARRRELLRLLGGAAGMALAPTQALAAGLEGKRLPLPERIRKPGYYVNEELTPLRHVSGYGNFLEFSADKTGHIPLARHLRTQPWTVRVEGLVAKPRTFDLDELLHLAPLEERIYRHRCVEGWSMVIPWAGFSLATLLHQVEPLGSAKFVEFYSHTDPAIMPNVRRKVIDFPYLEALRLDEALHPLTLLALGLYGEVLPNQNGAPLRLVVPWKYGFKGGKSIVRIRLVEKQPKTSWMKAVPDEYGFYANVNPNVDHPRWSQARERRLGEFFKRETLMFNGYAEQVGSLYSGMDLERHF